MNSFQSIDPVLETRYSCPSHFDFPGSRSFEGTARMNNMADDIESLALAVPKYFFTEEMTSALLIRRRSRLGQRRP